MIEETGLDRRDVMNGMIVIPLTVHLAKIYLEDDLAHLLIAIELRVLGHLYHLEDQDRPQLLHVHLGGHDLEPQNEEMIVLQPDQLQRRGDVDLLLLHTIHRDELLETHLVDLLLTFTQAV